jgi:hypothetical protein
VHVGLAICEDGYSFGGCKDARTIDGRRMKQPIARDGISAALHARNCAPKRVQDSRILLLSQPAALTLLAAAPRPPVALHCC